MSTTSILFKAKQRKHENGRREKVRGGGGRRRKETVVKQSVKALVYGRAFSRLQFPNLLTRMNEYANATEKQSFAFTDWLTTWGDRILTAEILVLVPAFLALQNTFSVNAPPAKNWLGRLGISAFHQGPC